MRIIAHRGASAQAPENTLAAFRRAIVLGAGMIELDVRLTRDGVPVVIHDESLSRTTDGKGRVGETDFAQLGRLSAGAWFDARFAGEHVPSLAEVFDLVGESCAVNVEIKAEPGFGERTARAALRVSREGAALGRILFSSFDPLSLEALRPEGAEIRLALLTGPSSLRALHALSSPAAGEAVLERMARWRHLNSEAACIHRALASAPLVQALHAQGKAVYVYTVDEEVAAERLDAMGVDGIFTNDPGRLLRRWPSRTPAAPA